MQKLKYLSEFKKHAKELLIKKEELSLKIKEINIPMEDFNRTRGYSGTISYYSSTLRYLKINLYILFRLKNTFKESFKVNLESGKRIRLSKMKGKFTEKEDFYIEDKNNETIIYIPINWFKNVKNIEIEDLKNVVIRTDWIQGHLKKETKELTNIYNSIDKAIDLYPKYNEAVKKLDYLNQKIRKLTELIISEIEAQYLLEDLEKLNKPIEYLSHKELITCGDSTYKVRKLLKQEDFYEKLLKEIEKDIEKNKKFFDLDEATIELDFNRNGEIDYYASSKPFWNETDAVDGKINIKNL